jgi:hypothetical protein
VPIAALRKLSWRFEVPEFRLRHFVYPRETDLR